MKYLLLIIVFFFSCKARQATYVVGPAHYASWLKPIPAKLDTANLIVKQDSIKLPCNDSINTDSLKKFVIIGDQFFFNSDYLVGLLFDYDDYGSLWIILSEEIRVKERKMQREGKLK